MSLTTLPKNSFALVEKALGSYADAKITELFSESDSITLDRDGVLELLLSGSDGLASLFRQGRNTIKSKKVKDPSAPKRATSAYLLWLNENREAIISEHFGENELTGREKVSKVGKKAGELWNAMNEDDKSPYIEKSKEQQAAYKAAMSEYKPSTIVAGKPKNLDFSKLPEAPIGWTGPFNGKKLHHLANGGKLGVGKFYSFDEAVKAADELGDSCSGITYEAKYGKYSLRKSFNWCGDGVEGEDCSWVRGEMPKPNANKPKDSKPKKTKKAKVVSISTEAPMEIDVESMTFVGSNTKQKKTSEV